MHEMSIVSYVINTLDTFAERNMVREIQTVVLQIGALSGVVPNYIRDCWEPAVFFSKHMKHSGVEIEEIPARGKCRRCGTEFDMRESEGICPACGSASRKELSGSEIIIKEVRIAESDIIPHDKPPRVEN